jgi:hypothetical protein
VVALGAYIANWAETRHQDWSIAIFAFGAAPFVLALFASQFAARDAAVRAPLLTAATVMTLPVTMFGYLLPLPALIALAAASATAWQSGMPTSGLAPLAAGAAVAFAASWVIGFALLFASEDARCTAYDGGVTCSSNAVAGIEAFAALGTLALGAVAVAFALRNVSRSSARAGV